MANSDISVSSVDHRQNHHHLPHSRYTGLAAVLNHLPPLHSRSNPGTRWSMSPRSTAVPQNTVLDSAITVPKTDNETSSSASSAKASKPLAYSAKTTDIDVQTSLDQQPHLYHYHGRSSQSMLPISSNKRPDYSPHCQEHQALGHLRDLHHFIPNFRFTVLVSMSSSIQPRDLDAEESPSVSHRALVAMNMAVQLAQ
ncbi:hypothetical protein BASA81_014492 [Batrachochytrium salamandrivorans]|nr:hypothetical protein BASA81_014492 [Batrachochytrium salamandrivorans]